MFRVEDCPASRDTMFHEEHTVQLRPTRTRQISAYVPRGTYVQYGDVFHVEHSKPTSCSVGTFRVLHKCSTWNTCGNDQLSASNL